jgi:hypothetical protein
MATPEWVRAFARQAEADFRAWELLGEHPQALVAECHRLQFLQMACEKICKAHLLDQTAPLDRLTQSHGYIAKPLPALIRQELVRINASDADQARILRHVKQLANEIQLLNPAVDRNGQRPDNCEYPWSAGDKVRSPLDYTFEPTRLVAKDSGRSFLKLLRKAIERLLQ